MATDMIDATARPLVVRGRRAWLARFVCGRRAVSAPALVLDEGGVTVIAPAGVARVAWADVRHAWLSRAALPTRSCFCIEVAATARIALDRLSIALPRARALEALRHASRCLDAARQQALRAAVERPATPIVPALP